MVKRGCLPLRWFVVGSQQQGAGNEAKKETVSPSPVGRVSQLRRSSWLLNVWMRNAVEDAAPLTISFPGGFRVAHTQILP